jgi:phosphoribosylformylglycinamidine cyclo-ligase
MKRVYRDSLGTLADLDFRTHAKGIYCSGQFDIVGSILGILDEKDLLTGKDIEVGDYLVGVKCFGLNTNGYSLVRRLAEQGKIKLDEELPGTGMTVGQALMKSHENYGEEVWKARELFGKHLRGGAHITGGGIEGNTRRLFSGRRDIKIKIDELPANPLFLYLQKRGKINELTMNKTYNRGIGMVYVVGNEPGVDNIIKSLPDRYMVIGRIVPNVKTDG